jgi:hypothetical protein
MSRLNEDTMILLEIFLPPYHDQGKNIVVSTYDGIQAGLAATFCSNATRRAGLGISACRIRTD